MQRLKQALENLGKITDEDWMAFSRAWEPMSVGRKVNLTEPDQVEQYTYFVFEGIQRLYYLDNEGREATIILTYEGDFGGVLDSFLLQVPSKYYYETLSKSELIRCRYTDFQQILLAHPNLKFIIDKALYQAFSGTMMRLAELQSLSSEEKFKRLLARSPHVLNKIPHKYLANYIGIDATNFSKLINTVKIDVQ
jgi:CRP-like cAMP-binding protein